MPQSPLFIGIENHLKSQYEKSTLCIGTDHADFRQTNMFPWLCCAEIKKKITNPAHALLYLSSLFAKCVTHQWRVINANICSAETLGLLMHLLTVAYTHFGYEADTYTCYVWWHFWLLHILRFDRGGVLEGEGGLAGISWGNTEICKKNIP